METDDKLKWLEGRINSSLRPRTDELKQMFLNDENRLAFHEFLNNEDVRKMFVYIRLPKQLIASLQPPHDMKLKAIFFLKTTPGVKLTKENMDEEVMYADCCERPLKQLDLLLREVYLPLLCSETPHAAACGVSPDKLMDVLHRLMAAVETTEGQSQGDIALSLPSIEVLAEAALNVSRRAAVLHVLETTVISWIKQIKGVLKHNPIEELFRKVGAYPGPLDEVALWQGRLDKLHSINLQLDSPIAADILRNLDEASSTYAQSFQHVRKDITKSVHDAEEKLKFLSTMLPWLNQLHACTDPHTMLKLFPPIVHTLMLVWAHSRYYHQTDRFQNLLRLLSNEVVHRAEAMVGEDVLREPLKSFSKLKEALRVCAAFRGTYLDYRDKALEVNEKNKQDHAEKMINHPEGRTTLISVKMYGPYAYQPKYGKRKGGEDEEDSGEEELWRDSPWPARNAPAFDLLNCFMERCNDVLELVQTTSHFRMLADAAEVGGAGTQSLDALVKEIHIKYAIAMERFFAQVNNVLAIDGSQTFERAFFTFRMVVKDLETKLASVLRQSLLQCPTIGAQLRLLEVFEGISGRELVQNHLREKDTQLVRNFTKELIEVRIMFQTQLRKPPVHKNMPPIVSRLLWVHGLKERIESPMNKIKKVSPHSLEGDLGWQMRDAYREAWEDFNKYEEKTTSEWQNHIAAELTERLKQPLLIAKDYDEDEDVRPQVVKVNLDPQLLLLLREIHYLSHEPFNIRLPATARELLRNTAATELRVTATRLHTIVSKYNIVMRTMTEFEQPLFERSLTKIDHLLQQGLKEYTWRTEESADFLETASALVCVELHQTLDVVQTNCNEIMKITMEWSKEPLDVFSIHSSPTSFSMEQLVSLQEKLDEDFENVVVPSGNRLHSLLQASFEAVHISEASPAWQDYVDYIDAIVLDGLKQACLKSLQAMMQHIGHSNIDDLQENSIPILKIRLEMIEDSVAYRPPLDESTAATSVQETVAAWLESILSRGSLVKMLGGKSSYQDYISVDEKVQQMVGDITLLVKENSEECKTLFELFRDYAFLWEQDVNQTFDNFLKGKVSPNPLRNSNKPGSAGASHLRMLASARSDSRASSVHSKSTIESQGLMGTAERSFLAPKQSSDQESTVPSLDEFDAEIDIYRTARDEIYALHDEQDFGWLRADLQPIKQVLVTFACKWMWTFTKYLSDQVTHMLESLDYFLKKTEPEIESITGEERDTASFMKMMRLFNEVSAQQQEMDGKFAAMHRTVLLVKKYEQKLPDSTQRLFDAAPARWNNLKTKVSLAKQRLGPRIQEESEVITQDLTTFGERVVALHEELDASEVYSRECAIGDAWVTIDSFAKRLDVLENEAQDLIELQELLETSVVNFSLLPQCRHDLDYLRQVWETVRVVEDQQSEWKRHRWQKMNTKFLREETMKQLGLVRQLPEDVCCWDVYMGLHQSITSIQNCLPLIEDLSNPAMRTRHWKQLVRVTGGAITIDNDTLKRMTLGELLSLGLQTHVDDVRAIVNRAVKDLSIEQSLKTYEEVWLSKVFELRQHVRSQTVTSNSKLSEEKPDALADTQSEMSHHSESVSQQLPTGASRSQQRTTSRFSNQSSLGRTRRTSISSLPQSLVNLAEDDGLLQLLKNTQPIFDELEIHQISLQAMQVSSAAGSFLDEVLKWQKRLQIIEAVLTNWLAVQDKWVELEEIYTTDEVRTALSSDANRFATVNRDFRLLMRATEKNHNVLQCCQRKNVLPILEHMNHNLKYCHRSLLAHLERRRQKFPRFYFLSMDDVLHIVCNGYDLQQVNLYISKLFENIGCLVFEVSDDMENNEYKITAIQSSLGEKLELPEPLKCEGQIEEWLPMLISSIKKALEMQVESAMMRHSPSSAKPKRIHSAGARKVDVTSNQSNADIGDESVPPPSVSVGNQSWTLDHVCEIVYLVTQIQLTKQTSEAVGAMDEGNKEAMQQAFAYMEHTLDAALLMLKGVNEKNKKKEDNVKNVDDRTTSDIKSQKLKSEAVSENLSQQGTQQGGENAASQQGSQKGSHSHRDSQADASTNEKRTTAAENSSTNHHDADNASIADQGTGEAVDTMNLEAAPLIVPKIDEKEVEIEKEDEDNSSEFQQLLFPAQMRKISMLIALLAYHRERLHRLMQLQIECPLAECFEWCSQLQYFISEGNTVKIQCLEKSFEYGFEYQGAANREVLTPVTDKVLLALTQAVNTQTSGLCLGPNVGHQVSLIKELSLCVGRPFYNFNCTSSMDGLLLRDIFRGYATTGCWISFNQLQQLEPALLSLLSSLLSIVTQAIHADQQTVILQGEEIDLDNNCACFATLYSGVSVIASEPERLLSIPSAMSSLPSFLTKHFRTVHVLSPDIKMLASVLLLSQGFLNATDLASKTAVLFNLCQQMMGTNVTVKDTVNNLTYNSQEMVSSWSQQSLRKVIIEAGNLLNKLMLQKVYQADVAKETIKDHEDKREKEDEEISLVQEEEKDGCEDDTEPTDLLSKEAALQDECECLVMAMRNTFMPRLMERDASIFGQLLRDLWPHVTVPLTFSGPLLTTETTYVDDDKSASHAVESVKQESLNKTRSQTDYIQSRSMKESVLNTPVVQLASTKTEGFQPIKQDNLEPLKTIEDAIAVATSDLGLMPGTAFQARVAQLAQLSSAHKTIILAGPAGCGKSECIKTYAMAERERGKRINVQSVFTKAVESKQLLGYYETNSRVWHDGLLTSILRKLCVSNSIGFDMEALPPLQLLQLDGQLDTSQLELMSSILSSGTSVVLANNERLNLPETLHFVWEIESISDLSPCLLSNVGIICMTRDDVGWRLILANWLKRRPENDRDFLQTLCDKYIDAVLCHLKESMSTTSTSAKSTPRYQTSLMQSEENMLSTFTALLEALIDPMPELSDVEIERSFNYAAIWAFGGTLDLTSRDYFSSWWRQMFEQHIDYPEDGMVFDYMVDTETHKFVKYEDILPSYSGSPCCGIPSDAFVNTVTTQQLLQVIGLLSDSGRPVLLVGESGCGKSSIVAERIRTVCSGEVAEVLNLSLQANRFTTAELWYQRLEERLEWKHGRTYVPRGNKRLLCFLDDINLSQVDSYQNQTAVELVRQHIDDGGFYDPHSHGWKYVNNVTYITTVNPKPTAKVPPLSARLLRHFSLLGCSFPPTEELQSIYGTLMHTHFISLEVNTLNTAVSGSTAHHLGLNDEKVQLEMREEEIRLKDLLSLVVHVTLELQDKLRHMFLPTAHRCHYIFTMKNLATLFRYLCLSLEPGCSKDKLLLQWEHECYWVYGHRMINEVDYNRFRQAFVRAVRKDFSNEEQIQLMCQKKKPIFSNLIEHDSGLVTAGHSHANNNSNEADEDTKTDLFQACYEVERMRNMVNHGIEEYNKTHPRIHLPLYQTVIEEVCRMARVISSPHEVAHYLLVAEGCPGRATLMAQLAANLAGFHTYKISPSQLTNTAEYGLHSFKADLVQAYTKAGVKGEKVLFLLEEEEMKQEDFLVYLTEFVVFGTISHLFSPEEQTTIINSIRTEVTQAGLSYTRDVAWNFFLRTVKNNFRVCIILSTTGAPLQMRLREYPSLIHSINILWMPHWTKRQLIKHASYHVDKISWMSRLESENLAHLLATMHLVVRQKDGYGQGSGTFNHLTNTSYSKFVEKFLTLAEDRHKEIHATHTDMSAVMGKVEQENTLARKLKRDLQHEKMVLEERKAGTVKVLAQIGQDTAITEQQVRIVKSQMEKIQKLKKLLPEYQVNHERAVYKTVAIVADTKKIVQGIQQNNLMDLRATSKPIIDLEDLMAAIIMILKGPNSDLTWQKGAKRQMANLERFKEELISFDEHPLPESTLVLVEPYLLKSSFEAASLEKKTENPACGQLCKWVAGVCRYNRMMISKVKPLHNKVEQTSQAIDSAEHKMSILDNKKRALEERLKDLARGFEEATIDKNEQEEKTKKMNNMLKTAARLKQVLGHERQRIQQVIDSLHYREAAIAGGTAMAAAFAIYLGPYHYMFRRVMLTVHWPSCLSERGVPLVIDSISEVKGRVIDWSIDGLKTASGASGHDIDENMELYTVTEENEDDVDELSDQQENDEESERESVMVDDNDNRQADANESKNDDEELDVQEENNDMEEEKDVMEKAQREEMEKDKTQEGEDQEDKALQEIPEVEGEDVDMSLTSTSNDGSMPPITSSQFNNYVSSLLKLLVGEETLNGWLKKDIGGRQLENAAIVFSSWQKPPLLIDPYNEGVDQLRRLSASMHQHRLIDLDTDTRSDPQLLLALEKSIQRGRPVLMRNCQPQIDCLLHPIIQHRNTALEYGKQEDSRLISFCGRKILCHPDFRLFLTITQANPRLTPAIASAATLVNYSSNSEALQEEFLSRAFACLRPALFAERRVALHSWHANQQGLQDIIKHFREHLHLNSNQKQLFGEKNVDVIDDLMKKTSQMSERVALSCNILNQLNELKNELQPLAQRASMLYDLLRSLPVLQHEYQFTLPYFLKLFDEALGGELPDDYTVDSDNEADFSDDEDSKPPQDQPGTPTSQAESGTEKREEELKQDEVDENKSNAQDEGTVEEEKETEEDTLPTFVLPEYVELPSEGADLSSLPQNRIAELVNKITLLVCRRIQQSLYEEHRLLFATLLCLNIQEESGKFSPEEITMLQQGNPGLGMQLSLSDFDCDADPPEWLPAEKLEDLMAVSVLPGPLDGLCVHVATYSEEWKEWYQSHQPEKISLPISPDKQENKAENTEKAENKVTSPAPESGSLTSFHQLLLLRLLRPDRLHIAMADYVSIHLNLVDESEKIPDVKSVMDFVAKYQHGVLVLLPPGVSNESVPLTSRVKLSVPPSHVIQAAAQNLGVAVEVVEITDGGELEVLDALSAAERNHSWVVLNKLHLATSHFLEELKYHLQRMAIAKGTNMPGHEMKRFQSEHSDFQEIVAFHIFRFAQLPLEENEDVCCCVWLVTEPFDSLSTELIQDLYILSWDSLECMVQPVSPTNEESPRNQQANSFSSGSLQNILATTIVSAFNSVSQETWTLVQNQPDAVKALVFGIGVVHGLLLARQMFGTRGMSQQYALTGTVMEQAIHSVLGKDDTDSSMKQISHLVADSVYGNLATSSWDRFYMITIVEHILSASHDSSQTGILKLGDVQLSMPPANVAPNEYGVWFAEKTGGEIDSIEALTFQDCVERVVNDSISSEFMRMLERLYQAHDIDELRKMMSLSSRRPQPDMLRLRAVLDSVWEILPPLLDLGTTPEESCQYNFPYHRPSVISLATAESFQMPESLGFVLFQECLWFNQLLCHIRQTLHTMHQCLLAGSDAFPSHLLDTMYSLLQEQVPPAWLHPNCQPSTHALNSWQGALKKCYNQLEGWVKHRMVPLLEPGHSTPVSYGHLQSIWLGGLVKPHALFAALRQEKAILAKCLADQVVLDCLVVGDNALHDDIKDEGGIFIEEAYIQGGAWDIDNKCLVCAKTDINRLPTLYVWPKVIDKGDNATVGSNDQLVYYCPVFMNKARQVCTAYLPLPIGNVPSMNWTMSGTAILLDPGIPSDSCKKSRSLVLAKAALAGQLSSRSSQNSQYEKEMDEDDEEEEESTQESKTKGKSTDRSGHSSRSQLSYRAMTPKASPLPPELQMTRQSGALSHDKDHHSSQESLSKRSTASQKSKVSEKSKVSRTSKKSQDKASAQTASPRTSARSQHSNSRQSDRLQSSIASTKETEQRHDQISQKADNDQVRSESRQSGRSEREATSRLSEDSRQMNHQSLNDDKDSQQYESAEETDATEDDSQLQTDTESNRDTPEP